MDKERDTHLYLFNNILDDDKEIIKKQMNIVRSNSNYSAPPSITLYDYHELERQIFGDENEQQEDICNKLPPPSPTKIPKKYKYSFDSFDDFSPKPLIKSQSSQPEYTENNYSCYNYNNIPSYMQYMPVPVPVYYPSNKQIHTLILQTLDHTIEMAKQRNHSKTLQFYFQNANLEDRQLIFQELVKEAFNLAKDPFGNYVIQKILEVGSQSQKLKLFELFQGKIIDLSLNSFGCRVIQRVIQSLISHQKQQGQLIEQISPFVTHLITDQNGNHVVQKIFECISIDKINCISQSLFTNIQTIAFHAFGCRVLQKFLERGNNNQILKKILDKLTNMMLPLCRCQYGNYIMQHLVLKGPLKQKTKILQLLKQNFVSLALDKYASNVIQKAIIKCNDQYRRQILNILQSQHPEDPELKIGFVVLARGQYSNYVIQRYLQRSPRQIQQNIISFIEQGGQNYETIKQSQYGRHVLSQLEKYR